MPFSARCGILSGGILSVRFYPVAFYPVALCPYTILHIGTFTFQLDRCVLTLRNVVIL